jgi:muramoyltetrapeptide carboxypeptidase LdcA involved in peptidoglycan recycling
LMDIHVYWNIFTMHGPMNVKFPNNTSKWQMEFNSAFKGLISYLHLKH